MIPFHEDLLSGAGDIALFLFGDAKARRKVYHLVETARLPVFRMGDVICARKSTLVAHFAAQERAAIEVKIEEAA